MVLLVIAAFVAGYLVGRARPPAVMAMEGVHEERTMTDGASDGHEALLAIPNVWPHA